MNGATGYQTGDGGTRLGRVRWRRMDVGCVALLEELEGLAVPTLGADARVMKLGADGSVVFSVGSGVVVKLRPLRGWWSVVRSWAGVSRGDRQWRGARLVGARGGRAARVVGVGACVLLPGHGRETPGTRVGGRVEVLVTERVDGRTVLEWLALSGTGRGLSVRDEHALACAVGRQVGVLSAGGVVDRDHKASNLVATRAGGGERVGGEVEGRVVVDGDVGDWTVWLVDPVGVRASRGGAGGVALAGRMFGSLMTESVGCGVVPRRGVWMRCVRAAVLEHERQGARRGAGGAGLCVVDDAGRRGRVRALVRAALGWATLDAGRAKPKDDPLERLAR